MGERINVSNYVINNSIQSIDFFNVFSGNNRRVVRNGFEKEADMDSETIAEEDLDAENDENLIEVIEDGFSKIAVIEASPRKNKGK